MLELQVSDVAADGSWVRLSSDVILVPPPARAFLRAQIIAHRRRPTRYSALLADGKGVTTAYALRRTIAAAFEEAGQLVPALSIEYRVHPVRRWLVRHGIAVAKRRPQDLGTPWITRNPPPPKNGPTHPWRRVATTRTASAAAGASHNLRSDPR